MKLFFAPDQLRTAPAQYFRSQIGAPVENPERMETLAQALAALGLDRREPPMRASSPSSPCTTRLFDFLQRFWGLWRAMPEAGPEVLPNVHPYRSADAASRGSTGRATRGRSGSPATMSATCPARWAKAHGPPPMPPPRPPSPGLTRCSRASAAPSRCAAAGPPLLPRQGQRLLLPEQRRHRRRAPALALRRVAILDFDTHHGDGTQAIFYRRGDILVSSSHTDPTDYYPFFAATPTSAAMARARARTSTSCWRRARTTRRSWRRCRAGRRGQAFGADALVVSAGWDAHRDDPLSRSSP